jgi:hypothetical protein
MQDSWLPGYHIKTAGYLLATWITPSIYKLENSFKLIDMQDSWLPY